MLLTDLKSIKTELTDLKELGEKVEAFCKDKPMIAKIGKCCRDKKQDDIKGCYETFAEEKKKDEEEKKKAAKK